MPEKEHKALNEGNFHHDITEPNRDKVKQWQRPLLSSPPAQQQRNNQERQHRGNRNNQYHAQHDDAEVHFPVDALLQIFVQELRSFESEKEKWSIVGNGCDVIGVSSREGIWIVARDQC